jgi:hypothetical protein
MLLASKMLSVRGSVLNKTNLVIVPFSIVLVWF